MTGVDHSTSMSHAWKYWWMHKNKVHLVIQNWFLQYTAVCYKCMRCPPLHINLHCFHLLACTVDVGEKNIISILCMSERENWGKNALCVIFGTFSIKVLFHRDEEKLSSQETNVWLSAFSIARQRLRRQLDTSGKQKKQKKQNRCHGELCVNVRHYRGSCASL